MNNNLSIWQDVKYTPRSSLKKSITTDVLIIGGGLTGVWAAYHCSKMGLKTVLIERDIIASGPAGKNMGMLVDGLPMDFSQLIGYMGISKAKQAWKFTRSAQKEIITLIHKHKINCGLEKTGSLYVLNNDKYSKYLNNEAKSRNNSGFKCKFLDKVQLNKFISKNRLGGAIYTPTDYLLDPVKLIRNIAKEAEKAGAKIYERTPALSFYEKTIKIPNGNIKADKIFIALESESPFIKSERGKLKRAQILVTKPLSKNALKSIGWRYGHMLWNLARTYDAIRLSQNRLMMGNVVTVPLTRYNLERKKRKQILILKKYFPNLDKKWIKIEYQWSCVVATSRRGLLSIGKIKNNYYSLGNAGNGLTHSFIAGKIIAEHFSGKPIPEVYRAETKGLKKEIPW